MALNLAETSFADDCQSHTGLIYFYNFYCATHFIRASMINAIMLVPLSIWHNYRSCQYVWDIIEYICQLVAQWSQFTQIKKVVEKFCGGRCWTISVRVLIGKILCRCGEFKIISTFCKSVWISEVPIQCVPHKGRMK